MFTEFHDGYYTICKYMVIVLVRIDLNLRH
jgi:hypothetical protein